jgi:hypothetical protein
VTEFRNILDYNGYAVSAEGVVKSRRMDFCKQARYAGNCVVRCFLIDGEVLRDVYTKLR